MARILPSHFLKCLSFFWAIIPSVAQNTDTYSFSGTVTDAQSGSPVPFASVSVLYKKTGTLSDSLGRYRLALPYGEYIIKFSHVGYLAVRQKLLIRGDKEVDVSLESISNQLTEVIVSSAETRKRVDNLSLGVEFLSIKGIKKIPTMMGEVDILRSIQMLPGVSSVGEGANGVNIRGGNVDQNLIFVDHMPIFNPTHMFGLFSVFSAEAIQDVELYKGNIPAQYGGRIASVMNVRMIEPRSEKLKLNGGTGLISNRFTLETPLVKNKLWMLASGRFSYNDFLIKLTDYPNLKGIRANFYDIAGKIAYQINTRNTLSLSGYVSHDFYQVNSLFALKNIVASQTAFRYGHRNASLQWNHYVNPKFNLTTVAAFSHYKTRTSTPDSTNRVELLSSITYSQLKTLAEYIPNSRHNLNMGISAVRYDIRPGNLNDGIASAISPVNLEKEQAWELSVFASDSYKIAPRLSVELGLRYVEFRNMGPGISRIYKSDLPKNPVNIIDSVQVGSGGTESRYGGAEPRLLVRYLLSNTVSIKFGYNRMQQFIQLLTNTTTPLPISRWKTASANIQPQQSDFYSLGVFQVFNEKWDYSVEGYYRQTRNILDYTASADLQLNDRIETLLLKGTGKAYGVEVMVTKRKGELTGWMSYTYARSLQQISGDAPALQQLNGGKWFPSAYDRPHAVNLMLNIEPDKHNSFSFTFSYATGRPFTTPTGYYSDNNQRVLVYTERNNARVEDYHRLDFSWTIRNATMKKKRWEGSWVFAVYNLYGRKNAYSYFFREQDGTLVPYKLSIFANPLVSLTYNFVFQ
jgi:hypothetical protein